MKFIISIIAAALILTLAQAGVSFADIEEKETIEKTLRFPGASDERFVVVDNVFGSIKVTAYDGDEVLVTARRTTKARSERKFRKAQREVYLDIIEDDDLVEIYVEGPFRPKDEERGNVNWKGYERAGYEVKYDFELKVPRDCSIGLKTVMDGDILVRSVEGDFDVKNVMGGVMMRGVRGSGEARSVNGDVTLYFDSNPREDCRFATINGEVKLYFQPALSADFNLDTFTGDVFTDFEVESLPPKIISSEDRNDKKIYKIGRLCRVRAGRGGPEITMDGFNGDMFILKKRL